jgi:hypothetical protein
MSDNIVMRVKQRRRATPPHHHKKAGRTSIDSDIDDLNDEIMFGRPASKSRGFNEWDHIPGKGDIDASGEPIEPNKDHFNALNHLAPWYKQRAKDIENDSGDPLKRELDLEEDGQTDI